MCLYQGEELGLPEAQIPYELLQDPWGITFWPEFQGRDGCRTPMPWNSGEVNCGFSQGTPWLPIPDSHRQKSVAEQEQATGSTLHFTRRLLRWRKRYSALRTGNISEALSEEDNLTFTRSDQQATLTCWFYFGERSAEKSMKSSGMVFHSDNVAIAQDKVIIKDGPGFVIFQHQS